jgi:restriction system protein
LAGSGETTVWGIHGGRTGDADNLFRKKDRIALGWPKMGDLSRLPASREAFKKLLAEVYPDKPPGAIPADAGQLFRFLHEMKVGDIVVYPSRADRQVHIGIVDGSYQYAPDVEATYPQTRPIKWKVAVPRTQFTQGALYEIGSAMSFFQVRNYADVFRAVLVGSPATATPRSDQDETVTIVAENIEELTRDFVLKRLSQELKGHPLTHLVAHLLNLMGYRTRVSLEGPDGGFDIIAHRDELGFEPPIIKVQVKSGGGNVGQPQVSALTGTLGRDEYGLFVTLAAFTPQARAFAKSRSNLRLLDGDGLVELILQHYDGLDSTYKGLLPLREVFVPEPLESESS